MNIKHEMDVLQAQFDRDYGEQYQFLVVLVEKKSEDELGTFYNTEMITNIYGKSFAKVVLDGVLKDIEEN